MLAQPSLVRVPDARAILFQTAAPPPRSRARRLTRARRLAVALTGCVALLIGVQQLGARWWLRERILPRVAQRLGHTLDVGRVGVGLSSIELRDVVLRGPGDGDQPFARAARVTAHLRLADLVSGTVRPDAVELEGVTVALVRRTDGSDNLGDLRERSRSEGAAATRRGARWRVSLVDVRVDVHDQGTGLNASARVQRAALTDDGTLTLVGGALTWQPPSTPRDPLLDVLTRADMVNVSGTVRYLEGQLAFDLAGGYPDVHGQLWRASGRIAPRTRTGQVTFALEKFALDRLGPLLARTPFVELERSLASGELHLDMSPELVHMQGAISLSALTVQHPWLAAEPVRVGPATATFAARYQPHARRLHLEDAQLRTGNVTYHLEGALDLGARAPSTTAPKLAVRLWMPPTPCDAFVHSLPPALAPHLKAFALTGTLEASMTAAIDWANLEATELHSTVGIDNCRVVAAPRRYSAERLRGSFAQRVPVGDGWTTFTIGPENPNFVRLRRVSPHLINAFLTTEDSRFFRHRGFIDHEFRSALIKNLERGRFAYGASSITMQVVKNTLLSREKTVSRKLEELFLTWYLETELSKQRIMEIYVNAIEFGPGLYGIASAARQYFGKTPAELNSIESAFLASLLPAPTRRYRQYCRGEVSPATARKLERILARMYDNRRVASRQSRTASRSASGAVERHHLDDLEYADAQLSPLTFGGHKSRLCRGSRAPAANATRTPTGDRS